MFEINEVDKKKKDIDEIVNICKKNKSRVVVLGGGTYGEVIAKYLIDNGLTVEVLFAVDDEYITEEQKEQGMIPFSEYLSKYKNVSPMVFGFYNYKVILDKREQYKDVIPYMFDFHITVVNGERVEWNRDFVMQNINDFTMTYEMLSSELSKATMLAYLNAAVAGDFHNLFVNYVDEVPYFNEKLFGIKVDRLFDCGAFDGDSAHDFVCAVKEYDWIFEFEPDLSNVDKINERVKKEKIRNLKVINKGVWSETTTLKFISEGKSSSSVSDEGDVSIDVIKLDDMFDEFTSNSLIKMDIEGSELEALKGAKRVISEISPALAICVYHKREDLITIPQYIDGLVKSGTYNYYIGYQGLDLAELVFYAVPNCCKC